MITMKKALLGLALICIFALPILASAASGAGGTAGDADKGKEGTGNGTDNSDDKGEGETARERIHIKNVTSTEEAKQYRTQIKEQIKEETAAKKGSKKAVMNKKQGMSEAVHMLKAMEGISGGIGKNVSAIATEFNNSMQNQIRHEERVENRGKVMRFFFGGHEDAASELEALSEEDESRVERLRELKKECSADCEELLGEQIQLLEQEQARIRELAKEEKAKKGLLGWIYK